MYCPEEYSECTTESTSIATTPENSDSEGDCNGLTCTYTTPGKGAKEVRSCASATGTQICKYYDDGGVDKCLGTWTYGALESGSKAPFCANVFPDPVQAVVGKKAMALSA